MIAVLAWLRAGCHGAPPPAAFAVGGLALTWVGIAWFVYVTSTDPRGIARRSSADYAAGLDTSFRSMFMPPRGVPLAWGQLCAALSSLAIYGFLHIDALVYAAVVALVGPPLYVRRLVAKRRTRVDNQVHGFALAFANALKTTASIGDALFTTVSVSAEPLRNELETAMKQMKLGSSLDEALLAMSSRAQSGALDVVVSALLIGRQTGGDLPRILEGTANSLRELKRLEEHTDGVATAAKQSLFLAASITGGFVVFLPYAMPGFLDPMKETLKGQLIAAQCAAAYFFAIFLGYRFTRKSI